MSSYYQNFTSKDDFEGWLRTGFENQVEQNIEPKAFPGASADLVCHDFPAEGLAAAYSRLSPDKQSLFRLAVADLINSWEITEHNATSLKHLLHLATLLPAKELLRGLPALLTSVHFQRLSPALADDLFYDIFLTITRLVGPNRESVVCLRVLVALPQRFRADWAGMALEALWSCDSANIDDHLQRLRSHLHELMSGGDYRPQRWAKRMLDRVGLYRIVQALPALKIFNSDNDTWLVDGLLLAGEQPLVEYCVDDDGNLRFYLAGKPDTAETLRMATWTDLHAYLRERGKPKDLAEFGRAAQRKLYDGRTRVQ